MKKILYIILFDTILLILSSHAEGYQSTNNLAISPDIYTFDGSQNVTESSEKFNSNIDLPNISDNNSLLLTAPDSSKTTLPLPTSTADSSIFVFSDLLYWKAAEAGADNWAQDISSPGSEQSAEILGVPFSSDAGFRVGAGYNSNQGWDAVIYYTGYNTNATDTASGNIYSSYLGNYFVGNTNGANFGPTYQSADIDWGINFHTLDLEFGHAFAINNIVNLHPFIGVKLASINQSIDTNWYNPINVSSFTTASENIQNNFSGIGPSIGLDTSFTLYKKQNYAFSIFGDFSGALLYGHWQFDDTYSNNQTPPITDNIESNDVNSAAPMVAGSLGLEWQGNFSKVDTTMRLGYEEQVWYGQLRFYSLSMGRLHDDLSLQGLTFDISFNFK